MRVLFAFFAGQVANHILETIVELLGSGLMFWLFWQFLPGLHPFLIAIFNHLINSFNMLIHGQDPFLQSKLFSRLTHVGGYAGGGSGGSLMNSVLGK